MIISSFNCFLFGASILAAIFVQADRKEGPHKMANMGKQENRKLEKRQETQYALPRPLVCIESDIKFVLTDGWGTKHTVVICESPPPNCCHSLAMMWLLQMLMCCSLFLYLTLKVLVMTIDAQWEGMGDVGSARYEPALLPPCPTIRVLSYSN